VDAPSSAHGLSLRGKTELEMRRRSVNIVALIKHARAGEAEDELLNILLARHHSRLSRSTTRHAFLAG